MKRALLIGLLLAGCRSAAPPQARPPSEREAAPESIVSDSAPARLRLLPTPLGYNLFASEVAEPPAAVRSLGAVPYQPPPGFLPRAGSFAFAAGHIVEAVAPNADGPRFTVYDSTGTAGKAVDVKLPVPCAPTAPALLQSDGTKLYAMLQCAPAAPDAVLLLTLDAEAKLLASRPATGASRAELFLHQPDADYVLSGRQVLRIVAAPGPNPASGERPAIGAVPTPLDDGAVPARELLRANGLILVVDGRAGRVTALADGDMAWRFELRFASEKDVRAVRAVIGASGRLNIVTLEPTPKGLGLFATVLPLGANSAQTPPRIYFGRVQSPGALPELVPADGEGGAALLVYVQAASGGPLVALRKLTL